MKKCYNIILLILMILAALPIASAQTRIQWRQINVSFGVGGTLLFNTTLTDANITGNLTVTENISAKYYLNGSGIIAWIKPENIDRVSKANIEGGSLPNLFVDIAGDVMTGNLTINESFLVRNGTTGNRLLFVNQTSGNSTFGGGEINPRQRLVVVGELNVTNATILNGLSLIWPDTAGTANQILAISSVSGSNIRLSWATDASGSGSNFWATRTQSNAPFTAIPIVFNDSTTVAIGTEQIGKSGGSADRLVIRGTGTADECTINMTNSNNVSTYCFRDDGRVSWGNATLGAAAATTYEFLQQANADWENVVDTYGGVGSWLFRRAQGTAATKNRLTAELPLGILNFDGFNGSSHLRSGSIEVRTTSNINTNANNWAVGMIFSGMRNTLPFTNREFMRYHGFSNTLNLSVQLNASETALIGDNITFINKTSGGNGIGIYWFDPNSGGGNVQRSVLDLGTRLEIRDQESGGSINIITPEASATALDIREGNSTGLRILTFNATAGDLSTQANNTGLFCTDPSANLQVGGTGVNCLTGTTSRLWAGDSSFTTSSEASIKTNIRTLNATIALTQISALRPVKFRYKDYNYTLEDGEVRTFRFERDSFGLIAGEANLALNDNDCTDGGKSINWNCVNAKHLAATIELKAEIDRLKARVRALGG